MSGRSEALSATLGVRPARVGIFVPRIQGISWMKLFELALATQSRTWGGSGNIVFPLDQRTANSELFWALADRLDADHWAAYAVTFGDMEELDPRWHERDQTSLRKRLKQFDPAIAEEWLEEHRGEICAPYQPPPELSELVRRRVASLHADVANPTVETSTALWQPQWPLTDAAAFAGLPKDVTNPATRLGPLARLLLTVELGRHPPAAAAALQNVGVGVSTKTIASRHQWAREVLEIPRSGAQTYPWAISEFGLTWYLGGAPGDRVTLVTGDSPWDFTLFYALRRWTSLAYWLPSGVRRNDTFMHLLARALEFWGRRTQEPIQVVSASGSLGTSERIAAELQRMNGRAIRARGVHWNEAVPDEPNRLFEHGNRGRAEHVPSVDGVSTPLDTPLPRAVRCRDQSEMRWMADVVIDGWSPLRNSQLGASLVQAPMYGASLARTSRTGLAYFCPHPFYPAAATLESITVRPRLRVMSLEEQLRQLVVADGWHVEPSDKGVWAAECVRLFGGHTELTEALRSSTIRPALDAYWSTVAGLRLGERRYLTVRDFRDRVFSGDVAVAEETFDYLLGRGVLLRGILLKCRRCRQEAWYDNADVGARFRCDRCRMEQPVEGGRWRGGIEPLWYYRLAEVVFQFLASNGHLPLLATEDYLSGSRRPTDRTFELKFRNSQRGIEAELDMAFSDGYRLVIGEASTTGRIEPASRLDTLRRIAEGVDAHEIAFATSRSSFPVSTLEAVQRTFRGSWPRVRLATGVQLSPVP